MNPARSSQNQPAFEDLVARFRVPGAEALVLMGSHARGDAGPFSDIDLVRFHAQHGPSGGVETTLLDGYFIVVSDVYTGQVEECFQEPERASTTIAGLRSARPLWDPSGTFASIQSRAKAFTWDAVMQEKANAWASSQMVSWIEEVQKGLAGLGTGHEGRLLNARYGLSWGMVNILRVQRGILVSGDNNVYYEVVQEVGAGSRWAGLSRRAFGMDGADSLQDQVTAGLQLYVLTSEFLAAILKQEDKRMVDEAVQRIKLVLLQ